MGTRRRKRSNQAKKKRKNMDKNKKIKVEESTKAESLSNDPPIDLTASSFRNWPELPEPLLLSILDHLSSSAPDLLAFASVCRPWRSAAASATRGPPLLLKPALSLPHRGLFPRWAGPPRARLHTLTSASRSYRSPVSSETLAKSCIGCSHAQPIFVSGHKAVVADAFMGREVQSPNFPSGLFHFSLGILTAPLASSSCLVLLVARNITSNVYSVMRWRPGSGEWSELKLTNSPEILSLVVFKGQVFGMDSLYRLIVVEFLPQMSLRLLEAQLSTGQLLYHCGKFGLRLVECDGELLMVLFVSRGILWLPSSPKIEVYRLDLSRSEWVKTETLGDWCLFIDAVGNCSFSCLDPVRWGGRKNCVYIAGPGYDSWSVFPLDGEVIDTTEESPLRSQYMTLPKWPSPVWVYPNFFK